VYNIEDGVAIELFKLKKLKLEKIGKIEIINYLKEKKGVQSKTR